MADKICFVIQPFSKFYENRFDIVYRRAIKFAGLIPCRSGGPDTEDIIDYIKDSIRKAHICFADITENNPNVFYEVSHADTLGKPLIMVCNERIRNAKELPTDIKGRNVLFYDGKKVDFEPPYRNGIIKDIVALAKSRMNKADAAQRLQNFDNRGLSSDMSLPIADRQTKDFGDKNMENKESVLPTTIRQEGNFDNFLTSLEGRILRIIFMHHLKYKHPIVCRTVTSKFPDAEMEDVIISLYRMEQAGFIALKNTGSRLSGFERRYFLTKKGRQWWHDNIHNQSTHSKFMSSRV